MLTELYLSWCMLRGYIYSSEAPHGRIGILMSSRKIVDKVYHHSPAFGVLQVKDKIIWVNDKDITGPAGTEVELKFKRGDEIHDVTFVRVPYSEVYD